MKEIAFEQLDIFEEAWAEVETDLSSAFGPGSASALKEMAFWLEGCCTDQCSDLHTAKPNR